MNERERIEALLNEGKINQEEAGILFEALRDLEDSEPGQDEPAQKRGESAPASGSRPATPAELAWVKVGARFGTLEVSVDPMLNEPAIEGEAKVERKGKDYEIQAKTITQRWPLGFIVGGNSPTVSVKLPSGYGLEVDAKAGTVIARGVPYLRGEVKAGTVVARDIGGIDMEIKAGTLDATLNLAQGQHRIFMKAGTANVRMLPGSDYRIKGEVLMGSLRGVGKHSFETGDPLRQTFNVLEGQGKADLRIDVKMGSLFLET